MRRTRGSPYLFDIFASLCQLFSNYRGGRHSCAGRHLLLVIYGLGILSEGELHRGGSLDNHIVHANAVGLYRRYLSGYRICAAGAGQNAGNARLPRLLEASVERVDGIERPEVRRDRVGHLVAVLALKGQGILADADMGMGIYKSGIECRTLCVIRLALRAVLHVAQRDYFSSNSIYPFSTVPFVTVCITAFLIITRSLLFLKSKSGLNARLGAFTACRRRASNNLRCALNRKIS